MGPPGDGAPGARLGMRSRVRGSDSVPVLMAKVAEVGQVAYFLFLDCERPIEV